ncbi:MAG: DUF1700 domain-containing protein [Eubacteriales bacterium]|nr:DUF1700 domain-containing protein [Eubacteriales bacterium]
MTKSEFISALQERLNGEISRSEAEKSVRYYEQYFDEAIRGGKTEEEVAKELGSPLLIAKTIIDTSVPQNTEEQTYYERETAYGEADEGGFHQYHKQISGWKAKLLIIVIVLVVIFLLATILRVLIPLAVPIAVILVLVHHFRNR